MTALLLLVLSVVFSVLAGEVRGLRQTMRERFTKTDAELHTVEAILDVHRGILDGLKSGAKDSDAAYSAFFCELNARQKTMKTLLDKQGEVLATDYKALDASFTGWFRELEDRQKEVLNGIASLADRAKAEDAAHERLALLAAAMEELRKSVPAQNEELRRLRDEIGQMSRELSIAAESGAITGERESVLSKAMEEGVMNLMGYAAGKAGSGIEVGLG